MKKHLFIVTLVLTLILISCSKKLDYRDDISCEDLINSLLSVEISSKEYEEYDDEYFEFFFEDARMPSDLKIIYSTEVNDIDELGIFRAESSDEAEKLVEASEKYIEDMKKDQRAFISSYASPELPKLDRAEVKRFGNYVIYAIMSEDDKTSIFFKADEILKK